MSDKIFNREEKGRENVTYFKVFIRGPDPLFYVISVMFFTVFFVTKKPFFLLYLDTDYLIPLVYK